MSQLHAVLGLLTMPLLAALALLFLVGATWRPATWMGAIWLATAALVLVQGLIGLLLLATGGAPAEWTHLIYGFVVAVLLLAAPFATAAMAPDVRLRVLVVAAAVALLLAWRLSQTG